MHLLETLLQDARRGVRSLRRTPAFTLAAVCTLALGIGATSAIFSIVDTVLLRPLPYEDPAARVVIWSRWRDFDKTWLSDAEVLDYRTRMTTLQDVGAWGTGKANLTGEGEPLRVGVGQVTANLFRTLGAQPVHGRAFRDGEDLANGPALAIISHGLWQRHYGGAEDVVGRTIRLDDIPRTIVGVMAPGFRLPTDFNEDAAEPTEVWVPLPLDPQNRGSHGLYAAARMKPGVTADAVTAELASVAAANVQAGLYPAAMQFGAFAVPLETEILGTVRPALWLLAGAVAFLLLIACGNVANLLLARAEGRQREIALRSALGAGGWRLLRQLLTESLVLAVAGGAVGLALALVATRLVAAAQVDAIPRLALVGIDTRVLLFTALVAVATTVLFGLVPALRALSVDLVDSLKDGGRAGQAPARRKLRGALVVAEMALSVMLVIGAGLMLRSLSALYAINVGFNPENVLTLRLSLPRAGYDQPEEVTGFYRQLLERVRALPGVRHAGFIRSLPLGATIGDWGLDVEGYQESPGNNAKGDWQIATDGASEAMGEDLLRGRLFTAADNETSQPVVIINETMARKYWAGREAVGGRVRMGSNQSRPWMTVVGVVADVRHNGITGVVKEKFYVPHAQWHRSAGRAYTEMTLVARTAGADPLDLAGPVRAAVREMDANVPVAAVRTLSDVVGASIATERFTGALLLVFALVALVLAAIGIYGVLSYVVMERTHEIGVRMAIGAGASDVLRMVLGHGVALALGGVAVGLGGALGLTRLMSGLLYGVGATDLATFVSVPAILVVVALAASAIPAWRAARVDPLVALRTE